MFVYHGSGYIARSFSSNNLFRQLFSCCIVVTMRRDWFGYILNISESTCSKLLSDNIRSGVYMVTYGVNWWMCLYDEMLRTWLFVSAIHVWQVHEYLQWHINLARVRTDVFGESSFEWQRKVLIISKLHGCAVKDDNSLDGSLTVLRWEATIGPYPSPIQWKEHNNPDQRECCLQDTFMVDHDKTQ